METNNNMTYQEAIKELETIVAEIEKEDIPVDDLLTKVKRSSELIRFCQSKLTQTEEEVSQVLRGLNDTDSADAENQGEELGDNQNVSGEAQKNDETKSQNEGSY